MSAISKEDLAFFRRENYVVVKDVIPRQLVSDVLEAIEGTVDETARRLLEDGKITQLHEDLDVLHRAAEIAKESREIMGPVTDGTPRWPALFRLMTCPELLDIVADLVGPEIVASSVYRVRPKLPFRPEGIVPWHQDQAYFGDASLDQLVLTCWVPLMNATVEAGCMEVMPGSHRNGLLRHYWGRTLAPSLTTHPDEMPDNEPVPVPADVGDVVLLSNLVCHRSTANNSGEIRWSLDLRYNGPDAGNFYPYEAEFMARSREDPGKVVTSADAFHDLRTNHVVTGELTYDWLPEDEETFMNGAPRLLPPEFDSMLAER